MKKTSSGKIKTSSKKAASTRSARPLKVGSLTKAVTRKTKATAGSAATQVKKAVKKAVRTSKATSQAAGRATGKAKQVGRAVGTVLGKAIGQVELAVTRVMKGVSLPRKN